MMSVGSKTVSRVALDRRSRKNSQKAVAAVQVSDSSVWSILYHIYLQGHTHIHPACALKEYSNGEFVICKNPLC